MPETKLIVGLGQGLLLRRCRHAIGATLLDDIAEEWRLLWRLHPILGAYVAEHRRSDDGTTVLVWPLVQYNISGAVVAAAARRYSVESRNVVVLHDDLDTKVGVLKWRHSGSAGGNGVKSVIGSLGTDVFSRVRVGVGRPASKEPGAIIAFVIGDVPDDDLLDGRIATQAVAALQELQDEPFFLAVGFHKPHLPFIAPKRYWDLYDRSAFPPPADDRLPRDAPDFATNDSAELRRYKGVSQTGSPVSAEETSRLIHGYHACVSCTDAQVGRLLDQLRRLGLDEQTVVVLFGDHGYHLAEKGTWTKRTAWELATRVPLIIRPPRRSAAAGGSTDALVELLDVYPTLVDLCGLPAAPGLEGRSLTDLLQDPDTRWPHVARSVITRKVPAIGKGTVTGRALRTPRYRWV